MKKFKNFYLFLFLISLFFSAHALNAPWVSVDPSQAALFGTGTAHFNQLNCTIAGPNGLVLRYGGIDYYLAPAEVGQDAYKAMSAMLISFIQNKTKFYIYPYNNSPTCKAIVLISCWGSEN